jgi:hypothetical protein
MSKKSGNYAAAGKELAILAVPACVLLAWLIKVQTDRPLDITHIKIQVSDLRSFSAEGKLLAEQALASRLRANYYDAHSRMLRDKAYTALEAHESSEPQSGLESQYREVGVLSKALAAASQKLSSSREDPPTLAGINSELARIESAAGKLERTLAQAQD